MKRITLNTPCAESAYWCDCPIPDLLLTAHYAVPVHDMVDTRLASGIRRIEHDVRKINGCRRGGWTSRNAIGIAGITKGSHASEETLRRKGRASLDNRILATNLESIKTGKAGGTKFTGDNLATLISRLKELRP